MPQRIQCIISRSDVYVLALHILTIAGLGLVAASKALSLQGSVPHGELVHQDVVEAQPPALQGGRGLQRTLLRDGGRDGCRGRGRPAERGNRIMTVWESAEPVHKPIKTLLGTGQCLIVYISIADREIFTCKNIRLLNLRVILLGLGDKSR